jgi:hypothetical protein
MEAPIANRAAADNTATNFVCFLIINALSFFFLKYFLKFLIALRGNYTSYKGNYGQYWKGRKCVEILGIKVAKIHKILNNIPAFS